MPPQKRYRCRFCGRVLPAWLPAAQAPERDDTGRPPHPGPPRPGGAGHACRAGTRLTSARRHDSWHDIVQADRRPLAYAVR